MSCLLSRSLRICICNAPNLVVDRSAAILNLRHASLTSAIDQGIRKSRAAESSSQKGNSTNHSVDSEPDVTDNSELDNFSRPGRFRGLPRSLQRDTKPKENKEPEKKRPPKRKRGRHHKYSDEVPERIRKHVKPPTSIPYTTPASEFIYGTSAVEAALRCTRRKLYKLYIYQAEGEQLSLEKSLVRKLALTKNIMVKMAHAEWSQVLDKMSAGRPHNGCILEASPLPKLPITALEPVESISKDHFRVALDKQTQEEAEINGTDPNIPLAPRTDDRYPFLLLLDGILDPGNLGAVIRSAYYLGVDAIILTGRNSAPLSPVTIKASGGAAENIPILRANNDVGFVRRSRANGWRFYAADVPNNLADASLEGPEAGGGSRLVRNAPTVLMLGSEATGLIPRLRAQADGILSIPGARIRPELGLNDPARVDSLNVSVAAALLIDRVLRVPLYVSELTPPVTDSASSTENAESETRTPSFDFQ